MPPKDEHSEKTPNSEAPSSSILRSSTGSASFDDLVATVRSLDQRMSALENAQASARARDDKTEGEIKEINDNMKGIAKEFRDGLKSIDDKLGNLISIRSLFFGSIAVCASAIVSSIVVFVQRLWYG